MLQFLVFLHFIFMGLFNVSVVATASKICTKNLGGFYEYGVFDGKTNDGPVPPSNLSTTCVEKKGGKWIVAIQLETEGDSNRTVAYVMVWSELNVLGGSIVTPCRQIPKVKNYARLLLHQPGGQLGGYRFKVHGVNKDNLISNDFQTIAVKRGSCKKGEMTRKNSTSECTVIKQPVGIAVNEDSLGVAFNVRFSIRTHTSSLTVSYRPLQGSCNWWNVHSNIKYFSQGSHFINVTLTDCVRCSRHDSCTLKWGSQIKLVVTVRYHRQRESDCDAQRIAIVTLPDKPSS
ncbi:uncharacterized protein LOC134196736 isoform X2 [Corticium candelabrum]|nr:uncharacterized protein LOC134196736 isoform X2 [Corticium candelabrum]